MGESSAYQERYLAHQGRKKEVLVQIMRERHSNRVFSQQPLGSERLAEIITSVGEVRGFAPSSCDRQAIRLQPVMARDDLALLGGFLVGGVGWIHRAPIVLLLFADPEAYVAGDEITFMPYLDAGCLIQQILLWATAEGLHSAYSNPNIRDDHRPYFESHFGGDLFCGAIALGYPPE